MHGIEIKIAEPDTTGVGEVLIRGAMVFAGYYKNPQANAEAFTEDGWFRSGDLGKLDKDGHLYIVGRGKDVIVLSSGKNVHPEDLEVHYLKCPLVAELAVIGVASLEQLVEQNMAAFGKAQFKQIVTTDPHSFNTLKIANSKEAIRHELDSLGRDLPEYQRVRDYVIRVEPLPRTATRKIKRFLLKQEIESGVISADAKEAKAWEFSAEDTALCDTSTAQAVGSAIRQNSKDADVVHPSMNLEIDLGLDSLARAEAFAALEQAFNTEFEGDEAAGALTVRQVIDLVNKHGGAEMEAVSVDLNWNKIINDTDNDLPEVQVVLKDQPIFGAFAFVVYKCFNLFCRVFMLLEVKGVDELRKLDRPFLICPNHQSFLDPFVLCSNYPYSLFRNSFHVGASEFFANSFMRYIATMLNVVPVNPDTELMRAMKAGAIGLKHGKVLNIYPEGERAFDGQLHGFKKGAAILSTELDLPIIPIAIDGMYKVWPRNSWRIRPAKVKITVGKPIIAREVIAAKAVAGEDAYAVVTDHLKQTIAEMIAEMRK